MQMIKNESKILLIEDNPDHVELTRHALKHYKLDKGLCVARDGVEALDLLFGPRTQHDEFDISNVPQVILLDLKLPKIDGLEVLRKIKTHPVAKTIPVVVMSSSELEQDVVECYRLGANSYVVKPVVFDKFQLMIRDIARYWLHMNKT